MPRKHDAVDAPTTLRVQGSGGAVFDVDLTPVIQEQLDKGELVILDPPKPEPKGKE